ncbi:MAG: HlyD family efflux transporter periplasmic adaptor subunit [Gammaproteobacteria bacterium]
MQNFIETWLTLQCRMIAGASRGVLYMATSKGLHKQVASWPAEMTVSDDFTSISENAIKQQSTVINAATSEEDSKHDMIAFPVKIHGQALAVIAVELTPRSEVQQRAVVQLLQWGSAWLDLLLRQQPTARMQRVTDALDLVTLVVQQKDFRTAATVFTTEIAQRYQCDQVSIGFCDGQHIRIRGLAYSSRFGERNNLMKAIASSMDEAWQEDSRILFPTAENTENYPHHSALIAESHVSSACSLPFAIDGEVIGVLTLIRGTEAEFDLEILDMIEHVLSVTGPVLETKRQNDRWIGRRLVDSGKLFFRRLFGAGYSNLKAASALVVLLALYLGFATGTYRVTAESSLEGSTQRYVVATIEGYISQVDARPGDIVVQGDLLATLDDKDLELEKVKLQSQLSQLESEQRSALAERNRTQTRIISAQIKQAEVQLQLVQAKLARTQLVAPIDGVIVAGDPGQSLGAPVEKGAVIYTISPKDAYRVVMQVDERDITELVLGQKGKLSLSSLPDEKLVVSVSKITPVASVDDGRNRFRVEAILEKQLEGLRPGMEGTAKIDISEHRLSWIWTHRLTDWVRLKVWSLLP